MADRVRRYRVEGIGPSRAATPRERSKLIELLRALANSSENRGDVEGSPDGPAVCSEHHQKEAAAPPTATTAADIEDPTLHANNSE